MNTIAGINRDKFIPRFDEILSRGLGSGLGTPDGQMCIEAAICTALDLPFSDNPPCVASAIIGYKIAINDKKWSSPEARAMALRDIGIAQLGSKGVVSDAGFIKRLAELTIKILIPALFKEVFPNNKACLDAALECEKNPTKSNAQAASKAANAAYAATAAAYDAVYAAYAAAYASVAAYAAAAAAYADVDAAYAAAAYAAAAADDAAYAADVDAAYAAAAAAYADVDAAYADAAYAKDKYKILSISLALQTLRELNSPGVEWLDN